MASIVIKCLEPMPRPASTTDSRRLNPGFGTAPLRRFSTMKVALLAELKAKPGKEDALAALLIESQPIAVPPRSEPPIPQLEANLEYTDERACQRRWGLSLPGCDADADDRNQRYIHPCAGRRSWSSGRHAARLRHNGRHVGSSGERTHRRPHDCRARPAWVGPFVEAGWRL